MPTHADRLLFVLAPFVSVFFALAGLRLHPVRRHPDRRGAATIELQAVTLNVGHSLRPRHAVAGRLRAHDGGLGLGQQLRAARRPAGGGPDDLGGDRHRGVHHGRRDGLRLAQHAGHHPRPGPAAPAAVLRELDPRLGHPHAAARLRDLPHRGDRRHEAHSLRHARGRVRDHRLLRRVQRDEVRHVRHGRLPRDGRHRRHVDGAVPRRLAGPVSSNGWLRVPLGPEPRASRASS